MFQLPAVAWDYPPGFVLKVIIIFNTNRHWGLLLNQAFQLHGFVCYFLIATGVSGRGFQRHTAGLVAGTDQDETSWGNWETIFRLGSGSEWSQRTLLGGTTTFVTSVPFYLSEFPVGWKVARRMQRKRKKRFNANTKYNEEPPLPLERSDALHG